MQDERARLRKKRQKAEGFFTIFKKPLHESLTSVLPIILIVLALCFTIAPVPNNAMVAFLLGGVLLYALRGHRRVQLTAWAVLIFLCDFVPTFGMFCRQADFVWTQMFTDYYEWFGVAAVLLMLLYNGHRVSYLFRFYLGIYAMLIVKVKMVCLKSG